MAAWAAARARQHGGLRAWWRLKPRLMYGQGVAAAACTQLAGSLVPTGRWDGNSKAIVFELALLVRSGVRNTRGAEREVGLG